MTSHFSLTKLALAVVILTVGLIAWLALAPSERSYGVHDHDRGAISAIAGVQQADGGPSCTHGTNSHRHSGKTHTTKFGSSHKHGSNHHHHGTLTVKYDSGGIFSSFFDRQCPRH
jgi:hypothetical protein